METRHKISADIFTVYMAALTGPIYNRFVVSNGQPTSQRDTKLDSGNVTSADW